MHIGVNIHQLKRLRRLSPRGVTKTATGFIGLFSGRTIIPFTGEVSFTDPEGVKRPFSSYYEQSIRPFVNTYEAERIDVLKKLRHRSIISIVLMGGLVLCVIGFISSISTMDPALQKAIAFSALLYVGGLFWWCYKPVRAYKKGVKSFIFPEIFRFFGEDYRYQEAGNFAVSSLEKSGIIPYYEDEYIEDYVKGSFNGVAIELQEATMTKTVGSGKNRRTITVFRGLFILLSMHKHFDGHTIVKRDSGKIGNWFSSKFATPEGLHTVSLEDPTFEKMFQVYSNDQVEARYLLTPSFMERLFSLSELFDKAAIEASFYDDRLLLKIPSYHNRFETASIFTPATFKEDINMILQEMDLIFKMVETLKLHHRTRL